VGHPWLQRLGQSQPEVQAQRAGHLVEEERAERLATDPPDDLTHQETERERVVTVLGTRLPERLLAGERVGHVGPVVERTRWKRLAQRRHASLMVEKVTDQRAVLAVLAELRPVRRDRSVEVEVATRGQDVRTQCRGALGTGPHVHQGVVGPRLLAGGIGRATPQIDDRLAVDGDVYGRADLTPLGEVPFELRAHTAELRRTRSLN
jgi:hypothetical protein